jgi:hypothetical protein
MARFEDPRPTPRDALDNVGLGAKLCAHKSAAGDGLVPRMMELEESVRGMPGRNSVALALRNLGEDEGLPIGFGRAAAGTGDDDGE